MTEDQWIKLVMGKSPTKIGDDAALLNPAPGMRQVVCSDSLVEGVHFLPKLIAPEDLGWKSLAVNLSDLAAMGAKPKASLLNLSVPAKLMGSWSRRFLKGYMNLSRKYGVELVGGDTTASPQGIFISVTALGEVAAGHAKWRTQAQPTDLFCVTGNLGDARAGLFLQKKKWADSAAKSLLKAHHHPEPRVEEGEWLGHRSEVTAMMDLSDGLLKDAGRLCQASALCGEIDLEKIPTSRGLRKFSARFRKEPDVEGLIGGEDYELLFTCRPHAVHALRVSFEEKFGRTIHVVGSVKESKPGLHILRDGKRVKIPSRQFEHF